MNVNNTQCTYNIRCPVCHTHKARCNGRGAYICMQCRHRMKVPGTIRCIKCKCGCVGNTTNDCPPFAEKISTNISLRRASRSSDPTPPTFSDVKQSLVPKGSCLIPTCWNPKTSWGEYCSRHGCLYCSGAKYWGLPFCRYCSYNIRDAAYCDNQPTQVYLSIEDEAQNILYKYVEKIQQCSLCPRLSLVGFSECYEHCKQTREYIIVDRLLSLFQHVCYNKQWSYLYFFSCDDHVRCEFGLTSKGGLTIPKCLYLKDDGMKYCIKHSCMHLYPCLDYVTSYCSQTTYYIDVACLNDIQCVHNIVLYISGYLQIIPTDIVFYIWKWISPKNNQIFSDKPRFSDDQHLLDKELITRYTTQSFLNIFNWTKAHGYSDYKP